MAYEKSRNASPGNEKACIYSLNTLTYCTVKNPPLAGFFMPAIEQNK